MIPKAFAEELTVLVNKHGIEYLVNMPDFILSGMICRMLEALGPCILETLEWHGCAPLPSHLSTNMGTSSPPLDITDMDKPCSVVALHRAEDFQSREITEPY
jgi:hypothetical protein